MPDFTEICCDPGSWALRILLTGATGFLGRALLQELLHRQHEVIAAVRQVSPVADGVCSYRIADISGTTDWIPALRGREVVVHAAARVHVMRSRHSDPLMEFRKVNVEGTLRLARLAAEEGVRRFVFISSIKVNGESTEPGRPFTADDQPGPTDPYAISKLEAEQGLMLLADATGMEVVIIRPPLVYGPGVKGNFASMIKLVEKGFPLPFGNIRNKRSLVGIDNLVDLIIRCIDHPAAANRVFLAGDGEDLSTTELLRALGGRMGIAARLIPVPEWGLQWGAVLLGKKAMAQRVLGSLQVDITQTCELLGWKPPYTVEEGLRRCFCR